MSTVTNPLGGLIEGLLQGHQLGMQLKRQQMEEQAFKTNQALHEHNMSVKDIMDEMDLRARGARPVQNGMVEEPGVSGSVSTPLGVPGPGNSAPASKSDVSAPGILRKAGGNGRFVTSLTSSKGEKQQYEIPTADEQAQIQLEREMRAKTQMIGNDTMAQADAMQKVRQSMLATSGVPLSPDIATTLGLPAGVKVLQSEVPAMMLEAQKVRAGNRVTLKPGEQLRDVSPEPASQPGQAGPSEPAGDPFADLTQAGAVQGPPGARARWDALLTRQPANGGAAAAGPPASGTAGAAPGAAAGPRVIATGGPPVPTGEFGTVYLPKFAASLGKKPADLSINEVEKALSQFKQANADPEIREATLASKRSAEATRDLANTMRNIQLGQMPTTEDAARMAEQIRNHELAPSQLSEIRGRGNGSLGTMIEREMHKSDPHFNWAQADADYNYSKSPGLQNTVRLMDSALSSIPRMRDAAHKLAMGNVRSVNSLIKLGKSQFNSIDLKKFQTDATLVGDEIGKIIQGGGTGSGVSDAKLTQAQSLLKDTDSPKAIDAALDEVEGIISYRRKAVTRGTYLESRTPLAEEKAAAAGAGAAAPAGGGGASYQHTATGKDGHKIGSNDGRTWVDLQTGKAVQ